MKIFKRVFAGFILITLLATIIFFPKLQRLYWTMHLFDSNVIAENFMGMNKKYEYKEINTSETTFKFPTTKSVNLPDSFTYGDEIFDTQQFIDSSFTTGFIVIQDDSIIYEKYYLGNTEGTQHISWSMAKSFVSAMMGIAIEEGYIESIEQNVEEYAPELVGSGYEGVKIKDVLEMSAGIKFNEDYGDFFSDINKWGRGFALGRSQDKFAASLEKEGESGNNYHYVSINTHVLGMVIVKATGKSLSDYLEEKLWKPMGMEHKAFWLIDNKDMEVALAGLNITLRDYAKLGQLYLHQGNWHGKQIVPKDWVIESVTPSEAYLMPGETKSSDMGYAYQWWIPAGDEGEFMAQGVYNQNIYINPSTKTVIVKLSANHRYNDKSIPYSSSKVALELFRAIAHQMN